MDPSHNRWGGSHDPPEGFHGGLSDSWMGHNSPALGPAQQGGVSGAWRGVIESAHGGSRERGQWLWGPGGMPGDPLKR